MMWKIYENIDSGNNFARRHRGITDVNSAVWWQHILFTFECGGELFLMDFCRLHARMVCHGKERFLRYISILSRPQQIQGFTCCACCAWWRTRVLQVICNTNCYTVNSLTFEFSTKIISAHRNLFHLPNDLMQTVSIKFCTCKEAYHVHQTSNQQSSTTGQSNIDQYI